MNILKEKVDVANDAKMRFQQLNIAHNSSIMMYAKVDHLGHGHLMNISRKLRPEFGRFFVSNEIRDSVKLLEKHNSDESVPGIDMVIMDADHSSIKFLDMINKRPLTKATASLPLISTIMVLPELATGGHLQSGLTPKEAQAQILDAGGASHVITHNTPIQEIFFCALESLSHRKTVETAFRDLKAAKIKAAKYPFLPIFTKKSTNNMMDEEENSDTDDDFAAFEEKEEDEEGGGKGRGGGDSVDNSNSRVSLRELDDWTESSSMLPTFVKESRQKIIQDIKTRHTMRGASTGGDFISNVKEGTVSLSLQDRQAADKNIIKFLNTGESLQAIPNPNDATTAEGPSVASSASSSNIDGSKPSLQQLQQERSAGSVCSSIADAGSKSEAGDDAASLARGQAMLPATRTAAAVAAAAANATSGRGRGVRAKQARAGPSAAGGATPAPLSIPPLEEEKEITDPDQLRDNDSVGKLVVDQGGGSQMMDDVSALGDDDDDDGSVQTGFVSEQPSVSSPTSKKRAGVLFKANKEDASLMQHLFDHRERPTFHRASAFKTSKDARKKETKAKLGETASLFGDGNSQAVSSVASINSTGSNRSSSMEPFIGKDVPDMSVVHSVGGLNALQAMEQWKLIGAASYDLSEIKGGHATDGLPDYHLNQQHGDDGVGGEGGGGPATTAVGAAECRFKSTKSGVSAAERKKAATDPAVSAHAVRTLKKMARDTAPDALLNNLIEIELSHGKVTVGDRDLLEAGLKAQGEGLHEVAITMYKRASLHTAKPHLSQLFLAHIHFSIGKYIQALEHLDSAIKFQAPLRGRATFSTEDDFVAHYNRAMVHFRLGYDTKGCEDLEEAIRLNPEDMRAKDAYPIVLRRMGKYSEAIESSKQNMLLRKEHERRALEAESVRKEKLHMRKEQEQRRKNIEKYGIESGGLGAGLEMSRSLTSSGGGGGGSLRSKGSSRGNEGSKNQNVVDEVNQIIHASAALTVHCEVEDSGGGSFASRKHQREQSLLKDGGSNMAVMPGDALRVFKLTNGFRNSLFDELFAEPSELQRALVVHPHQRTPTEIATIATTLRLFPFLRPIDEETMKELASLVEYRAVHNRVGQNLYAQNMASDGVVFLLRGGLQGRLEGDSGGSRLIVSEIEPYNCTGYVDILFADRLHPMVREVYNMIREDRENRSKLADTLLIDDQPPVKDNGKHGHGHHVNTSMHGGLAHGNTMNTINTANTGRTSIMTKATGLGSPDGRHGPTSATGAATHGPHNSYLSENDPLPDNLPRPLQEGMFVTYGVTHQLTEVLMINRETFERLLLPLAEEEFRKRIDTVRGCSVFSDWTMEDKVRLARMGTVRTYHSGDLVLKQGTKPECLCLIVKGMCKSYKAPNKSTVLGAKLAQAKEKAEKHDLKYSYDSKLRNSLSKGSLELHPKMNEKRRRSLMAKTHVTVSEALRYSLGVEIKLLEKDLAKALEAEQKGMEELSMDEVKESITDKLSEVSTLQWPQLFGEACVLDPDNGTSHGTIVADTTLVALCIHKSQIQTFRVKEDLLEKLKYRSVSYPEDEELLMQKERKDAWELHRQVIVKNLSTPKEEYLEPFYV
jgi:hypothetical protein